MQQRKKESDTTRRRTFLIVMTVNVLAITMSNAAPYDPDLEMKPFWVNTAPTPIIPQPCSRGERCWELLPSAPIAQDNVAYLLQEETTNNARLQNQRQIHRETDSERHQGKDDTPMPMVPPARSPAPIVRQISPRPVKKDVFMSRSWGPGGHPFSVLYMVPHANRGNHPNSGAIEVVVPKATPQPTVGRPFEGPPPPMPQPKHPNYRVTLRNGASGQPLRQYSIIPQLFISYGWGPLGK